MAKRFLRLLHIVIVLIVEDRLHCFGSEFIHLAAFQFLSFAEKTRATTFGETDGGVQERIVLLYISAPDVAQFFLFGELNGVVRRNRTAHQVFEDIRQDDIVIKLLDQLQQQEMVIVSIDLPVDLRVHINGVFQFLMQSVEETIDGIEFLPKLSAQIKDMIFVARLSIETLRDFRLAFLVGPRCVDEVLFVIGHKELLYPLYKTS